MESARKCVNCGAAIWVMVWHICPFCGKDGTIVPRKPLEQRELINR